MGTKILIFFIMLLLLCLCIYNWWFLKERDKKTPKAEKRKTSIFNTHVAWGIYSLILLFCILGFTGYELYILIQNIMNMQNQ